VKTGKNDLAGGQHAHRLLTQSLKRQSPHRS
jgi:hypothetical protein